MENKLVKFQLYTTQSWLYLVGRDPTKTQWRILKIDRSQPSELKLVEDQAVYSKQECAQCLEIIDAGNKATGGLTFITKVYGIVGFVKFLESFYMILVTKRRQVGTVSGHLVYGVAESQILSVPHSTVQPSWAESRYKKLVSSIDLTKDFFFSYTYGLMYTLQANSLGGTDGAPYDNMFVWNAFLSSPIRQQLGNTDWTVALIQGHFEQVFLTVPTSLRSTEQEQEHSTQEAVQRDLSVFDRVFSIVLIARRSRYFAGTRYLKRGVNDNGKVANDVETEQIVLEEAREQMTSVVQCRGSIPLFWTQKTSALVPKPDILIRKTDPLYEATRMHFEDLQHRYGNPIVILNLIKNNEKRPRELLLRRRFCEAILSMNIVLPQHSLLEIIHLDFHKFATRKPSNLFGHLGAVVSHALDQTDFYYSGDRQKQYQCSSALEYSRMRSIGGSTWQNHREGEPRIQTGVLRTNCIDCLDRTNVAQFGFGLAALGRQLCAVGFCAEAEVHPDSSMAIVLMDMYQRMGDALALQYGGSAAHNKVFAAKQGKWRATVESQELIKSIRRYYSNTYTDREKQDAINLFLGEPPTAAREAGPVGDSVRLVKEMASRLFC